jgi:hypothetical protein
LALRTVTCALAFFSSHPCSAIAGRVADDVEVGAQALDEILGVQLPWMHKSSRPFSSSSSAPVCVSRWGKRGGTVLV